MSHRWRTRLLAATVVVLAVLPLVIFATNATDRGPLVAARRTAMARAGVTELPDSVRLARQRAQRARIHPTPMTAALGITVQLFWVALVAVVGRKYFRLRL